MKLDTKQMAKDFGISEEKFNSLMQQSANNMLDMLLTKLEELPNDATRYFAIEVAKITTETDIEKLKKEGYPEQPKGVFFELMNILQERYENDIEKSQEVSNESGGVVDTLRVLAHAPNYEYRNDQ